MINLFARIAIEIAILFIYNLLRIVYLTMLIHDLTEERGTSIYFFVFFENGEKSLMFRGTRPLLYRRQILGDRQCILGSEYHVEEV